MRIINKIIAKTTIDKQNDQITAKALQKAVKQFKSCPVFNDFKTETAPLGSVISVFYKQEQLIAQINLHNTIDIKNKVFRLGFITLKSHIICFKFNKEERFITIIDELALLCIGMINKNRDIYND